MKTFKIANVGALPGEVAKGSLGGVTLPSGATIQIPVIVVNGINPGPTLVATGATHGSEIIGTAAIIDVIRSLDPKRMSGTFVAIPVANPLAFNHGTYSSPFDGLQLAMPFYFPSRADGMITERIAALIRPALDLATHYIDLHGNSLPACPMLMEFPDCCRDEATLQQQKMMAQAFGFTRVNMIESNDGSDRIFGSIKGQPAATVSARGIPGIMIELPGRETTTNAHLGRIGIRNVMKRIGMLEGDLEKQHNLSAEGEFAYYGTIINRAAGILWPLQNPGVLLEKGTIIAEIINPWAEVVEQIRMPTRGFFWSFPGALNGGTCALPEGVVVAFVAALKQ